MGNSLVVAAHSVLMNLGLLTHWCSTLCLALATKGLPVIQHMLSATAPFKGFAYNCPPSQLEPSSGGTMASAPQPSSSSVWEMTDNYLTCLVTQTWVSSANQ